MSASVIFGEDSSAEISYVTIDELINRGEVLKLFDSSQTVYCALSFYLNPRHWTQISYGPNAYASINQADTQNPPQPTDDVNKLLVLNKNKDFWRLQSYIVTRPIKFNSYDHKSKFNWILTNYNYYAFQRELQRTIPECVNEFIDLHKNTKYIVGHVKFLGELKRAICFLLNDKERIAEFFHGKIFVSTPPLPAVNKCAKCTVSNKPNHNDSKCSLCMLDKICSSVRDYVSNKCHQLRTIETL